VHHIDIRIKSRQEAFQVHRIGMARRQGHDGGIVPVRSRNDGQRQDQIFYKARHGPDPGQGSQAPHIMGDDMTRSGNPPRGRFDAGNAAKMGRQTDAAGCVAADVQGRRSIAMMRIIIETNPLNNWADKIERRST
jgi:hypothetical protein